MPSTSSSLLAAVAYVAQPQAVYVLFFDAEHFVDDGVGAQLDIGMRDGALQHDLGGAEGLAPVQQRDLGGEAGEEQRFFHGRVAAADHGDRLAAEEEAVAGGATGDAVADQRLLAGQTQPARAGAGGDDQRARGEFRRSRYSA